MPFTPTHALAVLPIRRWLPLSALVIGSLVPDLPLYFAIGVSYETTHSPIGLVIACVPLGLAAWLVYHALVKQAMSELLPDSLRRRLVDVVERPVRGDAAGIAAVVCALWLGALSHVVWDAFTHEGRWGVQMVGFLGASLRIGGVEVPGYALFQHGASLVGLPLLAWLAWRAIARQPVRPVPPGLPRTLRVVVTALLLGLPTLAGVLAVTRFESAALYWMLFRFVTEGGAWLVAVTVLYALLYRGYLAAVASRRPVRPD